MMREKIPQYQKAMQRSDNSASSKHNNVSFWENTTDRLVTFWYTDLPPLYGPLRLAFYGMMWIITLDHFPYPSSPHKSIFRVKSCVENRNELMHFPNLGFKYNEESGFFGWFLSYIEDPEHFWMFNCNGLVSIIQIAIVLSALGFGWKIPRILTAITYWIMLFMKQSTWRSKNTHSTLLGAFAFIALCFAENNLIDSWSIDSWLVAAYRRNWPVTTKKRHPYVINGASAGGAARKFVMCIAAVAFFYAGIHKVAEVSWLGWLDGKTLKGAIRRQSGHWHGLNHFFEKHDWLSVPLSVATIVGEVGAIAIVLSKWWRPFGIATLYMFHLGVFLLMDPNFICHCIDYFLIIEWRCYYERFVKRSEFVKNAPFSDLKNKPADEENPVVSSLEPHDSVSPTWKMGSWIYSILIALVFLAGLFRIDGMPFYSWCLYNYHPSDVVLANPFTQETLEKAAKKCMTTPPLNPACQHLGNYRHHDKLKDELRHRAWITAVIAEPENAACPIGVYENWELQFCSMNYLPNIENPDDELIRRRENFLDALVAKAAQPNLGARRDARRLPLASINMGLRRWYTDAIVAAIYDGTECFEQDAEWTLMFEDRHGKSFLSTDSDPFNAASRLVRQVRTHLDTPQMSEQYLGEGMQLLSLSLAFSYHPDARHQYDSNICVVGNSYAGEKVTNTWGNHQVGNPKPHVPAGDFTKIWVELWYILALTCAIVCGSRWREVSSCGLRLLTSSRKHGARSPEAFRRKEPMDSVFVKILRFVMKFQFPLMAFVCAIYVLQSLFGGGVSY